MCVFLQKTRKILPEKMRRIRAGLMKFLYVVLIFMFAKNHYKT